MNQLDLVNIYFIMLLFILCMCVTAQMSRSEVKMPEPLSKHLYLLGQLAIPHYILLRL